MQKYANPVELEKCCQTHIFLQKFVFFTAENEPAKILQILQKKFMSRVISAALFTASLLVAFDRAIVSVSSAFMNPTEASKLCLSGACWADNPIGGSIAHFIQKV